jgi:two-component sensor histidine kinase
MILHELATNSLKYGALSVPGGNVSTGWKLSHGEDGHLTLFWREKGAPGAPDTSREGFGTRLIQSLVKLELNGRMRRSFEPGGLSLRIDMPHPQAPPPA